MHLGVSIDLTGRGLEHLGLTPLGHAEHVDGPGDRGLHGLDGIVLIVPWSSRTGEIVDLINLEPERMNDVVPEQFKVSAAKQVGNVCLLAGKEVVSTDDIMSLLDQPFAEVTAKEAGTAGDENAF